MITGNLADTGQPTTVLIASATPDGAGSGLMGRSLVTCYNLSTVRQRRVIQVIGHFSDALIRQVNDCLKTVLALP